jgi:CRP/FNR family transcriptional regulator/CRP/FNR family cyclic AMP-dependent transcriptional regulator
LDEISLDLPMGAPGVDLLQKVPLFAKLGFEETTALAQLSHVESQPDGHVIIAQDSLGGALYIIKEGRARVSWRNQITGEVRDLAVLEKGALFGEMTLIDDQLASADVAALGPVELLVIPRRAFDDLLASDVKLSVKVYRCFCRSLSDKLRKANSKIGELSKPPGK